MPPLRELQRDLLAALLPGAAASTASATPAASAASLLADPRERAAARLGVYRNTVRGTFEGALRSSFPVIARLVGADYFREAARELQRHHPSRSGDLRHAGQPFPAYLARVHAGDGFDYLADVARLEWLIEQSLLAADHAPLDLEALSRVAPSAYDDLRFELHPSLQLFESRYPALRIWEANAGDARAGDAPAEPPLIDLDSGGVRLAINRRRWQLEFHHVDRGEHAFLRALNQGAAFSTAVCTEAAFDPSAALQRFVAAEAIVGFRVP